MENEVNETPQINNEASQGVSNDAPKTDSRFSLGLRTDERTGRKIVETIPQPHTESNESKTEETPQEETQVVEQTVEEKPQQVVSPVPQIQYYNPAEMSLAMQLGNVDESRIPPEYQPHYMALKQKTAPPPKSEEELRTEFLDSVNSMAKEQALKDLGITEEDVSLGEFSDDEELRNKVERYKAAVEINRSKIVNSYNEQLRIEKEKARQENEFKQGVANWINEERNKEPHFDEIGFFMQEHYKTMPWEKAAAIAPAVQKAMSGQIDPQSIEIVKAYYDDCRKEFYAKKNGTSTKPIPKAPSVEKKGSGLDVEKPIDYAEQLRTASQRDKTAIVAAWLNSINTHR